MEQKKKEKNMNNERNIPECYLFNLFERTKFYHIIYKSQGEQEKSADCVVNFVDEDCSSKFKSISGSIHYVLRLGGYNNAQIFIENNRNPNDNNSVEIKKSHGNSRGKVFMEQYFDPNCWIDFSEKCHKVFREILKLHNMDLKINNLQFRELVREAFNED